MKIISGSAGRRQAIPSLFRVLLAGAAIVAAPQLARAENNGAIDKGAYAPSLAHSVLPNGAFRIADDATPPASAPDAPPPTAPAAAPPSPEKITQENMFWESAQKSNTVADYKAYLEAFPNGVYAPLAKNRIAAAPANDSGQVRALSPDAGQPAQPGPDQAPPSTGPTQANAPQQQPDDAGPALGQQQPQQQQQQPQQAIGPAISPEALRTEIGTAATEQSLNLNRRDAMVLQRRLSAAGFYSGPIDGDLGPGSRTAIVAWQQSHGVAPTGQLGPLQLATIQAESAPVNGQRVEGQSCPPGFHPGPYGRRCWANR
jgi:Putative peptidoglycan binding domain